VNFDKRRVIQRRSQRTVVRAGGVLMRLSMLIFQQIGVVRMMMAATTYLLAPGAAIECVEEPGGQTFRAQHDRPAAGHTGGHIARGHGTLHQQHQAEADKQAVSGEILHWGVSQSGFEEAAIVASGRSARPRKFRSIK